MAKVEDVRPGEFWAYRVDRNTHRFHEVEVLTVGRTSPHRVKVQFVADDWQGRTRWVSPARLEARWEDISSHIERMRRYWAITKVLISPDELDAAQHALTFLPDDIFDIRIGRYGVGRVLDVEGCAQLLGLNTSDLEGPLAFRDQDEFGTDALLVPWATTRLIAAASARANSGAILTWIEDREREATERIQHTEIVTVDGIDYEISPDEARRQFEKYELPSLDQLRALLGEQRGQAVLERRELTLRLARLRMVTERAIGELDRYQKRLPAALRLEMTNIMRDVRPWGFESEE